MSNSGLQQLIESATQEDKVDLRKICQTLGVKVKIDESLNDLCRIDSNESQQATIWFKQSLDKQTKLTLIAIALAELVLHPNRVNSQGVNYDVFFLRDLTKNKTSKLMMLATRLAMPEHIIDKVSNEIEVNFSRPTTEEKFDVDKYIRDSNYLPDFVRCSIKQCTGMFLLDTLQ